MRLSGHLWTMGSRLAGAFDRSQVRRGDPWALELVDPDCGEVRLTGWWRAQEDSAPGGGTALVAVHGLGGSAGSLYMSRADFAAERAGLGCLRLNLRGSDRQGDDLYHAGLTADLHAALASPALAACGDLFVVGFSLGGHVVLKAASEGFDPRVRAVAAVCSPIDLAPAASALDRPARWAYRTYVLRALKEIYHAIARRGRAAVSAREVSRIRYIREWDDRIVAPRFGFDDAADYYRRASVGLALGKIGVPAMLVAAENDPMIPAGSIRASLPRGPSSLSVFWTDRGGHVSFPGDLSLGIDGPPGLENQILAWLEAQRARLERG